MLNWIFWRDFVQNILTTRTAMVFVREVDFVIHLFVAIIEIPSTKYLFVVFDESFYYARDNIFHGMSCVIQISLTVLFERLFSRLLF